jgi:type IV pilus assembly protein PilX
MKYRTPPLAAQRGVVLITSMIMLVVMTLFAVTAVRMMSQQERMVSYSYDRGLAFQAAEAALREAESAIETSTKPMPVAADPCKKWTVTSAIDVQLCPTPAVTVTRWNDSAFTGWANATPVGTGTLAITPKYFVEYMGNTFPCKTDPGAVTNCKRYRVTAKAGGAGRAAAMVQSLYATD